MLLQFKSIPRGIEVGDGEHGAFASPQTGIRERYSDVLPQQHEQKHNGHRRSSILDRLRHELSLGGSDEPHLLDHSLTEALRESFVRSGYGLGELECIANESTIVLYGLVRRYFDLQMAINLTRKIAGKRQVILEVDVVPMPLAL